MKHSLTLLALVPLFSFAEPHFLELRLSSVRDTQTAVKAVASIVGLPTAAIDLHLETTKQQIAKDLGPLREDAALFASLCIEPSAECAQETTDIVLALPIDSFSKEFLDNAAETNGLFRCDDLFCLKGDGYVFLAKSSDRLTPESTRALVERKPLFPDVPLEVRMPNLGRLYAEIIANMPTGALPVANAELLAPMVYSWRKEVAAAATTEFGEVAFGLSASETNGLSICSTLHFAKDGVLARAVSETPALNQKLLARIPTGALLYGVFSSFATKEQAETSAALLAAYLRFLDPKGETFDDAFKTALKDSCASGSSQGAYFLTEDEDGHPAFESATATFGREKAFRKTNETVANWLSSAVPSGSLEREPSGDAFSLTFETKNLSSNALAQTLLPTVFGDRVRVDSSVDAQAGMARFRWYALGGADAFRTTNPAAPAAPLAAYLSRFPGDKPICAFGFSPSRLFRRFLLPALAKIPGLEMVASYITASFDPSAVGAISGAAGVNDERLSVLYRIDPGECRFVAQFVVFAKAMAAFAQPQFAPPGEEDDAEDWDESLD